MGREPKLLKYEVQPLVEALRAFGKVSHSCFSMELIGDWENDIRSFSEAWKSLVSYYDQYEVNEGQPKIMYTEKVHVLIHHVPQFCLKFGSGLGVWSEQAGESLHTKYRKHLENYANVPKHVLEDKELGALLDFNSKQL